MYNVNLTMLPIIDSIKVMEKLNNEIRSLQKQISEQEESLLRTKRELANKVHARNNFFNKMECCCTCKCCQCK